MMCRFVSLNGESEDRNVDVGSEQDGCGCDTTVIILSATQRLFLFNIQKSWDNNIPTYVEKPFRHMMVLEALPEKETLVSVKVSHSNGRVDHYEIGTPCFDEDYNPCTLERACEILFDGTYGSGAYTYTIS